MGKYDALFADDEEAPKGAKAAGKYAALFDEPAPQVVAQPPQAPSLLERLRRTGSNIIGGAKAIGNASIEAAKSLPGGPATLLIPGGPAPLLGLFSTKPAVRHEIERGLSDVTTGGLAEAGARGLGGLAGDTSFTREQAGVDAAAAPGVRTGAGLVGTALPSPVQLLTKGVGRLVPGAGALPGGARAVAQYEAVAPISAAIQAEPGQRLEAAKAAATDPTGLILSGTTGAVGGALARAPERVQGRGVESVSRGEAGGTANSRIARKAQAKDLYGEIGNDLPLEAAVSVLGKSNPKLLSKMLTKRLDRLTEETEPIYQAIDNAPDPRFAKAENAPKNGGVDLGAVEKRLEASMQKAKDAGRPFVAESYDKALARLRSLYGEDGAIVPGTKLPARSMRNFANEVGEGLIPIGAGDAKAFSLAQQAKRSIYGDVVGTIEDEGKRVGVDVGRLKQLNRKISTFAATRDAYADRAARAEQGHTTLGNLAMGTALIGGGGAAGGIEGALTGAALEAGRRTALPLVRGADFALAKLVQASRAGSKPAQLGQMALQLGLSQEVADRISRGGLATIQQQPEDQP